MDLITAITLIIFFVLGVVLLKLPNQIATFIAGNFTTPLKWFFADKPWVIKEQERAIKFMKILVYITGVFCFGAIILIISAIIW